MDLSEITISGLQAGYAAGDYTAAEAVAWYLDRIERIDRAGPRLNAVISVNPEVAAQAEALDDRMRAGGAVGPLHGVPVLVKDQIDAAETPTTLGSVMFRDNHPKRDAFVIATLREAGALILGKTTLGEMGAGDTHGSLFGSTRNPYDLERTAGGSSGGSGAAVSANLCAVALGQEGYASIRRPSIWNGVAGMRPSIGLVSRGNVYDGWPSTMGSVGPMCRTVEDCAKLLDAIAGYDPTDPSTALGVGRTPESFSAGLSADALRGRRIGVLRTVMGHASEPDAEDFARIEAVFESGLAALREAGAELVDPIEIEGLVALKALRAAHPEDTAGAFDHYVSGLADPPFRNRDEAMASPLYAETLPGVKRRWEAPASFEAFGRYAAARELLRIRMLDVMARHRLDAIVHKAVEHEPTLIRDGVNPPFVNMKGAPHINTFLGDVPSVVVPAGFTSAGLPGGITFLGRPYDDAAMLAYAHAFEAVSGARRPPVFEGV